MSSWVRLWNGKVQTRYERKYSGLVKDMRTGETFPFSRWANGKRELFERYAKPFYMEFEDGSCRMVKLVKTSFKWEE